ncbi:MAG: hypothetical protein BV456_13360 [Thermoplasmata archaeon M8B2D]|nr:MAG: hypothetical protein BV456_13360 [Thermoplasmata archaeon M8B2D]
MKFLTINYKRNNYTVFYTVFGNNSYHVEMIKCQSTGCMLRRYPIKLFNLVRNKVRKAVDDRKPVSIQNTNLVNKSGHLVGNI